MINLRKDVERMVRPIRASTWRKNQMREELLTHLEGLLAEEKARRGDDVGAVRRAQARFGEPGQLATELQATVSRWERWAFVPVPGLQRGRRRPGETLGAYQRRFIVRMTCLGLVWGGFAVGCASWPATNRPDRVLPVTGSSLHPAAWTCAPGRGDSPEPDAA